MNVRNPMIPIAFATLLPAAAAADLSTAVLAEVRDAQGQVVLSGTFVASEDDDGEIERKAPLAASSAGANASGEAEIEGPEVEFSVKGVQPGGVYTFVIDGEVFATVTADSRGRAEHESEVPLPR